MYIKIKYIKQFILISACLFLAGFNYFTYANADNTAASKEICNISVDSDCDGLTNAEEQLYGTDAKNPDTDGDGYSDGVEIKSGYDPLKPAPDDKLLNLNKHTSTDNLATTSLEQQVSMTDDVIQKIQGFIKSNGNKNISTTDIQSLMDDTLIEKSGKPIQWDTLPNIDSAQLKILNQSYPSLNAEERKAKLQEDAAKYIITIAYLLDSNAPASLLTDDDAKALATDFLDHLYSFSTLNPDFEYFTDIENRFGLFSDQAMQIEVPETMLSLHIKLIRWAKGFSELSTSTQKNQQDPVANIAAISSILNFAGLLDDFSKNDFQNYLNQLK